MTIKSFDYSMPKQWHQGHLGFKLEWFTKNYVLPKLLGEVIVKKSKITFGLLDPEKVILKYDGDELGVIAMVGSDLIFASKPK